MIAIAGASRAVRGRLLLQPTDLAFAPGQLSVILGPNGAGKTTLLGLIAGDRPPSTGSVSLDGRRLERWGGRELARRRAVVTQHQDVSFAFTVREILGLARLPHGDAPDPAAVAELSRDLAIAALLERSYATLSGGERQRVQLARALLQIWTPHGPEGWLLLDEVTAHMDIGRAAEALAFLRRQAARGVGIVAVLHDLNLAGMADRAVVLDHGRVVADGSPPAVLGDHVLDQVFAVRFERLTTRDGRMALVAAA